jgi:hypothetical protein
MNKRLPCSPANMATASKVTMSFSLCPVIAEALKRKNPIPLREIGAMHPAMHGQDRVLRLHSCRALSPRLREQISTFSSLISNPKML